MTLIAPVALTVLAMLALVGLAGYWIEAGTGEEPVEDQS